MAKRIIWWAILLLALGISAFFAWQVRQDIILVQVSDAQTAIKPAFPTPPSGGADTELPLMDFTGLQAQNPEITCWLTVNGLGIDYPVVQAPDNSYYIDHTAEKKYNKLGAIFLDYRVHSDFTDFNNVVYGHNMKSGQMFGRLPSMKEQTNFDIITAGILYTPGKTYRVEIFAVAVGGSRSDFYNYIFPDTASKQAHLDYIKQYAKFYREIGVTADDTILSLSTCSYEYKDARTVVVAKIQTQ